MQFIEAIVSALAVLPPQLATFILGALPIGELRVALPVALLVYKLPVAEALFYSLLGNVVPVYFLLVFLEKMDNWLKSHWPAAGRVLQKIYDRTRHKLAGNIAKYGPWALIIFVGIPLPLTGAWTGAVAAFVFGLKRRTAFISILLGLLLSAAIVIVLTLGGSLTVRAFFR